MKRPPPIEAQRLATASQRLRRRPGRPKTVGLKATAGLGIQGAALKPAIHAGPRADFAVTVPPRGLPMAAAAAYSGLPVRALWRLIAAGKLATVRLPGVRRAIILREHLDQLLEAAITQSGEGEPRQKS